jgi:(1->4)-alpha-D-glucan 1-alpha-D-glucosylmutase
MRVDGTAGGGRSTARPRATYRLQFRAEFPLAAARPLVPYFGRLGVSHLYSSPLLKARRGSTHGYDVVDPTTINPEIGSEQELRRFVGTLRRHGLGLILDIVPNHMAVGDQNPAWDDVLAHGRRSRFAAWFDIDWAGGAAAAAGRVVLPVLGDEYTRVVSRGEFGLGFTDGAFRLRYFEHSFPLDPVSVPTILTRSLAGPRRRGPSARHWRELEAIGETLAQLAPHGPSGGAAQARRREQHELARHRLEALCRRAPPVRRRIAATLDWFGGPAGRPALRRLLDAQAYRLVHWRRAGREVNYRRFFSINELVAVRVEDPAVFAATHAHVLGWVGEGLLDGLRIDHIDGLRDPLGYLRRLRRSIAKARGPGDFSIYVEKILSAGERLPGAWPVRGTTGYEFIAQAEPAYRDPRGVGALEGWYRRTVVGRSAKGDFSAVAVAAKSRMLQTELAADVERLRRLMPAPRGRAGRGPVPSSATLRRSLIAVIAHLPVYRTYVDRRTARIGAEERQFIDAAVAAARRRVAARDRAGLDLVARLLRLEGRGVEREAVLEFVERFQQTSGPAMAKGLEDTAHYAWVPLLSRNEVGTAPEPPHGDPVEAFHSASAARAGAWPGSMLAVTTHDTKRSADVRARLDVLSEVADEWTRQVEQWYALNRRHRPRATSAAAIDRNTEYLLYQTLVGVWPLADPRRPPGALPGAAELASLRDRVAAYMLKATREAKVRTSWIDPNAPFERTLEQFVRRLLDRPTSAAFLQDLAAFVARIGPAGLSNALARTLVQLTAPGVPDTYQGDELWNFTLVDPDNRGQVDFESRQALLGAMEQFEQSHGRDALVRDLVANPQDGRMKLHVIRTALERRWQWPALFASGTYEPVRVRGPRARHVMAFALRSGDQAVLAIVPRLPASLAGDGPFLSFGADLWEDTTCELPGALHGGALSNVMTDERFVPGACGGKFEVRIRDALGSFPVALIVRAQGARGVAKRGRV